MTIDWGALFAALQQAADDLGANRPLPPAAPATSGGEIAAALRALRAALPSIAAEEARRPGVLRAIEDVLAALEADGMPGAGAAEAAIEALPDATRELEAWIPTIQYWLGAFAPAPGRFVGIA